MSQPAVDTTQRARMAGAFTVAATRMTAEQITALYAMRRAAGEFAVGSTGQGVTSRGDRGALAVTTRDGRAWLISTAGETTAVVR